MFKDKIRSATTFIKDYSWEIAGGAAFIGFAAFAIANPEMFEEAEPEIPTYKIIHVHVHE